MHDSCIGPLGHGRAWQMLAKKIEQVATVVLGGTVDMGRFPSLLRDSLVMIPFDFDNKCCPQAAMSLSSGRDNMTTIFCIRYE
ncbi:hypothetical protein J4E82_003856 [Alternaria postmessia]|nr:uncharacterized protein J4E82_003856 [Alternaria postmessia]KAI5377404.1 hypothetical protein J4E82_003856 [Alternaria postmessia]